MKQRRRLGAIALALVLAPTAACGSTGGSTSNDTPAGSNAGGSDGGTKKAQPDPKFGQTYTWDNGLSVRVSKPKPYTPGEYATKDDAPAYRIFEVTVVNKTGKPYDPTLFFATVQSGDQEASEVFDEPRLKGAPQTKILNGRQSRFSLGYGVQRPKDLVMEIETGMYEDGLSTATFTS